MTIRDRTPQSTETVGGGELIPDEIRERIVFHGETAPYHRRLQRDLGIDYADLQTWADLRSNFDYLDDDLLRSIDPYKLVPEEYGKGDLVRSQSSGTTGRIKEIFWHEDDVRENVDYVVARLVDIHVPENAHWVATVTPNPVLKRMIRGLAARYNGTIETIEVDPTPIKQALQSGDRSTIATALNPVADRIREIFERNGVAVYEDIAPLMQYVSSTLPADCRDRVELALIGGVGTDDDTIETITEKGLPNATLTGWYGDYMNGSSMMRRPETLEYLPQEPNVRLEFAIQPTSTPSFQSVTLAKSLRTLLDEAFSSRTAASATSEPGYESMTATE
ncbi:hypothetical protein ACFQO4_00615 [Saliphagus sp. GCM10025334]